MLNQFFTLSTTDTTVTTYLICTAASLILGIFTALIHMYKNNFNKNFILTLVILPAIVQVVIMIVNGNLGTGIAVMGAFSLVRFRSIPGNSREIASVFLAMAVGLATGTGHIGIAGLLLLCVGAVILLIQTFSFGATRHPARTLKISIPENLDYEGIFDEIFAKHTTSNKLLKVKTANMGSLFELEYLITLKKDTGTKELIDDIRCRNGNLPVVLHFVSTEREEL